MSESENVKVKQQVHNIRYFNKDTVFTIRKKQTIDNKMYYQVKISLAEMNKAFSRSELFALKSNFLSILAISMQYLRSFSYMSNCLLKKQQILLFKFLSLSLIFSQIKKNIKKHEIYKNMKYPKKQMKSQQKMKSKNFQNSKI